MQMIQMARETNCHQVNASNNSNTAAVTVNNNTSSNCDHNHHHHHHQHHLRRQNCSNLISSSFFTPTASSKMGLLSISLDTKANCNGGSSVISPSCQPVSCMNHGHDSRHSSAQQVSSPPPPPPPPPASHAQASTQQQREQCTLQQQPSAPLNHVKQLPKQQETCSIVQGKQRRQFDDQSVIITKPSMSFTSCSSSKSCNRQPQLSQQLICKQHNLPVTGNHVSSAITSSIEEQQSQHQVVYNNTVQPSNITDILIKSSANSGYCSSFGSSSTSFFDDEEATSQTCDHNVSSHCDDDEEDDVTDASNRTGHDDNNIDADGLVDHVVADAGDDEVDGLVESNCRNNSSSVSVTPLAPSTDVNATTSSQVGKSEVECKSSSLGKSNRAMHIDQVTCNLSNTTIDDGESSSGRQSNSSSPSNCTNNEVNNLPNVTGDDDDDESRAYPIHIECGCNELTLMIEENLTAAYLINILLLRFSLHEDISWTLFMKIKCKTFNRQEEDDESSPLQLECMIEDFEEVVPLVLKYQTFAQQVKLILRRSSDKLTMYNNLPSFFDLNMIDLGEYGRVRSSSISFTNVSTHSNRSNSFDGSNTSIRKPVTNVSSNEYQALQRFLLISDTFDLIVTSPVKLIRSTSPCTVESHSAVLEKTQLTLSHVNSMCKDVIDFRSNRYDLFTCCTDASVATAAPPPPPAASSSSSSSTGEHYFYLVSPNESCPMYKIISSNQSTNACWISCLRLAKIGMQNMRRYIKSYKASLNSSSSSSTLQQQQLQLQQQQQAQPVQSHLRHGSFGSKSSNVSLTPSSPPAINSYNATAIANVSASSSSSSAAAGSSSPSSSVSFSRQNNMHTPHTAFSHSSLVSPSSSSTSPTSVSASASTTLSPANTLGPWFYENLSREQASKLLSQYLSINGVFLVRQSTRSPGTFVLSLVLNRKILHIIVMNVHIDAHTCYLTLDQGKTKFADLSQLIQFYQLNHSLLGCKLTHYVSRG